MKIMEVARIDGRPEYIFFCPGCNHGHIIIDNLPLTDDLNNPTFSISVLIKENDTVCHSIIKNGQIEYSVDTTHKYAGQLVDMLDFDS
jgi:hypothetical protein